MEIQGISGSVPGGADVWFDDVLVVLGNYGGGYFDGYTPDEPSNLDGPVGTVLHDYEWTGTPENSPSTLSLGVIAAVEDPEQWDENVTALLRRLHNVTCISGPLVEQKFKRGDTYGMIVEFTLAAGTPWVFSDTRHIDVPPSLPVVVQDVPFNLTPYPSAAIASGTVVVATNLMLNPSLETNATNWAAGADPPVNTSGTIVGARSTELANPPGVASFKVRYTATTTLSGNTNALYALTAAAPLPTGAGRRASMNGWMYAAVVSGTAVLGDRRLMVDWQNAGGTSIGNVILGPAPVGGGSLSRKSMLIPDAATQFRIVASVIPTSFSTGAVIDLFVDTVAVTVP